MRYELSDQEWGVIGPMLPNKSRGVGDDCFPRFQHINNIAHFPKPLPKGPPAIAGVMCSVLLIRTLTEGRRAAFDHGS